MRFGRRRQPLVSAVIPAYNVAAWLPACLDSLLAQDHEAIEAVVVDDGSTDSSAEIALAYAARDARVRVVRSENRGLGAARNLGIEHATGDLLAFLDGDDTLPVNAYSTLAGALRSSGSDFATGSIVRCEPDGMHEPPWMRRLHHPRRLGIRAADHPEILGDVFACTKMFRRSFWDDAGLAFPVGVRYEDQPTATLAYLRGRFDVLPEVVYHWLIRADGTSITQQRSTLLDLSDRIVTKRMALASVDQLGDATTRELFRDRVLAGDLHRYFVEIPGCSDDWWALLEQGVREFWGERSLTHSGLPPVHRLTGWLVEQGRRTDAAAVMAYAAALGGPLPRTNEPLPGRPGDGAVRLDLPPDVLDLTDVPPEAVALRPHER